MKDGDSEIRIKFYGKININRLDEAYNLLKNKIMNDKKKEIEKWLL